MKLSEISISTLTGNDEVAELYERINNTATNWPAGKSIVDIFHEMVVEYASKPALKMENVTLTYQELDQRSNQVANWLITRGVQKETVVAIYLSRSINMIVSILGIIKAGGAYVPINTDYPFDRIKYIIKETKAKVLIGEVNYLKEINQLQWSSDHLESIFCIDSKDFYKETETRKEVQEEKETGLVNSYTGEPFSAAEIEEYTNNVFLKLRRHVHKNKKVLEIGCGSGTIMNKIAPYVQEYYGTDRSEKAIDDCRRLSGEKNFHNIKLRRLDAADITLLEERDFDIIIINNVIQDFRGFNELRKIIGNAIDMLAVEGKLFIGNIPDLDKKDKFITDLQEYKKANPSSAVKLDLTNELFVPRIFFNDLQKELPVIQFVENSDKTGMIRNELFTYSFDTLLRIDKTRLLEIDGRKRKYQYDARVLEDFPTSSPGIAIYADQLSHIIFTSGSTGNPKGVMVEHSNIVRTVKNTNYIEFKPTDVVLQACEISFDPSTAEIFGALLNGATLCLISKKKLYNTTAFANYLIRHDVSVVVLVTSLFHLHTDNNPGAFSGLRYLLFGGEVVLPGHIKKVQKACPALRIVNCYGPTENSVISTTFEINGEYDIIPIGKPIANSGVYILNKQLQKQPAGVPGELFVSGDGIARGYLNDPVHTDEKFIESPFRRGERLYRTGDMARIRQDGNLEFLGRRDDQVKVKGHRVELQEIEQVLTRTPQINQALVTLTKEGVLCAYITLHENIEKDDLKNLLGIDLPAYMIPQYIVKLQQFPVSPNGKIDRNALPDPEAVAKQEKDSYVAPANALEATIVSIYEKVLGKERIGTKDDFFELGGHSLLATKVLSLINKELNVNVRLEDIFENPKPERLAKLINTSEREAFREINPLPKQENYDLSYAQRRLWVLDQVEEYKLAYNIMDAYEFKGNVDAEALQQALQAVTDRHESLRTNIVVEGGRPVQKIHEHRPVVLTNIDLTKEENPEAAAGAIIKEQAALPFNLAEDQLMQFILFRLDNERYAFFFKMHHIISDGWSMELMIKETSTFYNSIKKGNTAGLQPLKIHYKDFAAWQNSMISGDGVHSIKQFWKEQFTVPVQPLQLPLDFERPAVKNTDAEKIYFNIDKPVSDKITAAAGKQGATLYMTLLSIMNVFLHKLTGQTDIVLGSPVAGRQHAALHAQIGLYLNTLPIRTRLQTDASFTSTLEAVKKTTLGAFDNQAYPVDLLIEELKIDRNISRSTLFDVGFTWQNVAENSNTDTDNFDGFSVLPFQYQHQKVKTDLWFHGWEKESGLKLSITFDKALFNRETILQFIEQFQAIAEQVANDPEATISTIVTTAENILAEKKRKEKKKNTLNSFLNTKRSAVPVTPGALVKTGILDQQQGFPLIIQPAIDGVMLTAWIKDNEALIAEHLRKTGAVLFRGFSVNTLEAFEQVSKALGDEQMKYMDQSSPRSLVSEKIYTSTDYPADQPINMHNELSYSQDWPMRIIFFCLRPPASEGETPISDSRKVLNGISAATQQKFAEKGVMYVRNLVDGLGLSWRDVYQTKDKKDAEDYCIKNNIDFEWLGDNHMRISWKKPAIYEHPYTKEPVWFNHGFFFNAFNLPSDIRLGIEDPAHYPSDTFYGDGTPIAESEIEEIRQAFEKAKVNFPWQKGDVLLLDNMLIAHGRNPFTGDRKILVGMNTAYSSVNNPAAKA